MFWNLRSPESCRNLAEWNSDEIELEGVICPKEPGHQRGGKRLSDLSILLPGKKTDDFVWTWYSECLIQEHVLRFFQENKVTGFDVKPAKARYKRKSEFGPSVLWELIVTGWAGIASEESGIHLTKKCDHCGMLRYSGATDSSKVIIPEQWDGSDIFMVWPMPAFVFISERFKDLLKQSKFKGFRLVPVEKLKLGTSMGFGPGRLSNYMPEERARLLGEPLGIY